MRLRWPVVRQLFGEDRRGLGAAVQSQRSRDLVGRVATADAVVRSVCPYCAVGCGQRVYVKDGADHPDRGRPRQPDLARAPLPEGLGDAASSSQPERARAARQVPPAVRHRVGGARRSTRRWT